MCVIDSDSQEKSNIISLTKSILNDNLMFFFFSYFPKPQKTGYNLCTRVH